MAGGANGESGARSRCASTNPGALHYHRQIETSARWLPRPEGMVHSRRPSHACGEHPTWHGSRTCLGQQGYGPHGWAVVPYGWYANPDVLVVLKLQWWAQVVWASQAALQGL